MDSGQRPHHADATRRIASFEAELRCISDDELMKVEESIVRKPQRQRDGDYMAGVYNETQRRFIAAGWFWRRWLKPNEYKKWVAHVATVEEIAAQELIDVFDQYGDPASQEVARRLSNYIRGKDTPTTE